MTKIKKERNTPTIQEMKPQYNLKVGITWNGYEKSMFTAPRGVYDENIHTF